MKELTISVIGLGKLGLPTAAVLAAKGYQVVGCDMSEDVVRGVNLMEPHIEEPRLIEVMEQAGDNLLATQSTRSAVLGSDVTYVIVPTPSDVTDRFSTRYVKAVMRTVAEAIRDKDDYHLVNLVSTVMPGTMSVEIVPLLEDYSDKKWGKDFGLTYNPEFVALGTVIKDYLNPDIVLIGEGDKRAGDMLQGIYENVVENDPTYHRMSFVNAEITKLSINTFLPTKVTFANTIAQVCEQIGGHVDVVSEAVTTAVLSNKYLSGVPHVDVISDAVGADSRIGRKFLTGATPTGGTCLPRDVRAFRRMCEDVGASQILADTLDAFNEGEIYRLAVMAKRYSENSVAVLGLSYKPGTPVAEESTGVKLANAIANGRNVIAYDPMAMRNASELLREKIKYAGDLWEAIRAAEVIVITTPWDEFKGIAPMLKGKTVIDCWRILEDKVDADVNYIGIGIGKCEKPPQK